MTEPPPVRVLGVRHHGPGSARAVVRALDAYRPDCVLIEGPADADPLVGCLMPKEVWDAPDSVKQLLVALYEDATKQELMPTRQLPVLFRGLQDAAVVLAEADAFNDAARRIQDIAAWRA